MQPQLWTKSLEKRPAVSSFYEREFEICSHLTSFGPFGQLKIRGAKHLLAKLLLVDDFYGQYARSINNFLLFNPV
jgi:hypothetical protein